MNAFSPAWLALREPADLAARNRDVLAACRRYFADHGSLTICDIGAGTGASVRALADSLPPHQNWTLVDHDEGNLAAAIDALSAWADTATRSDGRLTLRRGARDIVVSLRHFDFAQDPAACWTADTGLVTVSALLDLTSENWIDRLATGLSRMDVALLATLTFDGAIIADPPHPLDGIIAEAFRAHQKRDKGFGPAAGPTAADCLKIYMERLGYEVVSGNSPWCLSDRASDLVARTVEVIAQAAREAGAAGRAGDWRQARLADTRLLTIGHLDVFAHRK